jgi:hypothetical protein
MPLLQRAAREARRNRIRDRIKDEDEDKRLQVRSKRPQVQVAHSGQCKVRGAYKGEAAEDRQDREIVVYWIFICLFALFARLGIVLSVTFPWRALPGRATSSCATLISHALPD